MAAEVAAYQEPRASRNRPTWIWTEMGNVMKKGFFSAVSLVFLLGAIVGCTSTGAPGDRQSGITMYGTVDAGVSVTR
ncbi:hypothetical protein N6G02_07765 [Cupriavidus gilardii]|uniref:hypothetical protein n=1 Tax=Cupriavidus TaxID=106589 RepID=UPI0012EEA480|nr:MULTISPECIES: hypothetical protein [Cupriavidus]MCT9116019.1 hypothetical protein [Cupriavidus gilardii]